MLQVVVVAEAVVAAGAVGEDLGAVLDRRLLLAAADTAGHDGRDDASAAGGVAGASPG